jgi:hypothetical protein
MSGRGEYRGQTNYAKATSDEAPPVIDRQEVPAPGFWTSPWSSAGIATLHAAGHDIRSALEAGLRAVLVLTMAPPETPLDTGRSAPIRGEGDDLGCLFADLAEDLLEQIEFFGSLDDVVLDGILRREDGGYVGWGHASLTIDAAPQGVIPRLLGTPTASEGAAPGVVLRASLQRP